MNEKEITTISSTGRRLSDEQHGFALRSFPALIALILTLMFAESIDVWQTFGTIFLFYCMVECVYGLFRRQTWLFTAAMWLAWGWFLHRWSIEGLNAWASVTGPLLALLIFSRVLVVYWAVYQNQHTQADTQA